MEATDHTITVGDLLPATIDDQTRLITVTRISPAGMVYTDDWRVWWYHHPSHTDGQAVHGTAVLHVHQIAPVATSRALVLVGVAA